MLDKVNKEIILAMKSGDEFRKNVLKMMKTELQINEKAKNSRDPQDVINSYYKKLKKVSEDDRYKENIVFIEKTKNEMKVVEEFLPKTMSRDDIELIVDKYLSLGNMGAIMNAMREEIVKGGCLFDGKLVSEVVRNKLK